MRSYNAKVKGYLCKKTAYEVGLSSVSPDRTAKRAKKCCAAAFLGGVILFSRRLRRDTMTLSIENEELLELCTYIMIRSLHTKPDVKEITKADKTRFEVSFADGALPDMLERAERDISVLMECEGCIRYFLRGAFLAAGNIYDPSADYRAEFVLKDAVGAELITSLLDEELSPRTVKRNRDHVVYIKGGERVESFFTMLGAEMVTLDIIEKSIEKETMNNLNRSCNCENANLKKTVDASVRIRLAIRSLKDSGRFQTLSDDLKETAELRVRYPDATLSQLAAMTEGGMSRSGINHRLRKLIEISEE